MNLIELNRALRQLRLGGIAAVLEMRLHQAQVESMAPIDLISCLVSDELTRRGDRLLERRRKQNPAPLIPCPLLSIHDLGRRKSPRPAGEELLKIIRRRYERASTMITSNRPADDWGKLLGDSAAVAAMLDRLLHHGHVLKCGPRSWRTRLHQDLPQQHQEG